MQHKLLQDFDIKIASITSAHGIQGYMKLFLFLENAEDLVQFTDVFDEDGVHYKIRPIRPLPGTQNIWIIGLSGVTSRTEAEKFSGKNLFIKRSALPILQYNEYYHEDLIGMQVLLEDGTSIGAVVNVANFGAGDILEVLNADQVEYYPFHKDFIVHIDLDNKTMTIAA